MRKPFDLIFFDKRNISLSKLIWQVTILLCLVSVRSFAADWSETNPPLNLTHIFEGEINNRGKAVGFHARYLGQDPENSQLLRIISGPNERGVYTGEVEIYDEKEDRWKRKAFTSFFPDQLTKGQIQKLILKAYHEGKTNKRGKWRGKSGLGFAIEGWLCPKGGKPTCPHGAINTAYPIYKKDQ